MLVIVNGNIYMAEQKANEIILQQGIQAPPIGTITIVITPHG